MERASDQLLARSRFSLDEDRRIASGYGGNKVAHPLHLVACVNQIAKLLDFALPRLFARRPWPLSQKPPQKHKKIIRGERFEQIVGRPGLHGRHRGLDGAVGGHHNSAAVWVRGLKTLEHGEPIHLGEPNVQQGNIKGPLLDETKRLLTIRDGGYIVTFLSEVV